MEAMLSLNDLSTWLFMLSTIIAMGIFMGGGTLMMFVSVIIIALNTILIHEKLQSQIDKAFVYERFKAGDKIECGLWRGSRTLADPAKGWRLEDNRFVRDEQILTDASLCEVVNKKGPEVPWLESVLSMIVLVFIMALGRFGLREQDGRTFWSGEHKKRTENDLDE